MAFARSPKVLNVSLEGDRPSSGPSYTVVRQTKALTDSGVHCSFAGLSWKNPRSFSSPCAGMRLFPVTRGLARMGVSPQMNHAIESAVARESVNVIHCHSIWLMPPVYCSRTASRHRIPFVVSPHGTLSNRAFKSGSRFKPLLWKFLQRPAMESTACFHVTAESEYEDIRRHGFRQPIAIIPAGIDLPPFCRTPRENSRTLLFLSRIHPIKGIANLLHAWARVQDKFPLWQLHIVGPDEGGHLKEMQALATTLKLRRVEFRGAMTGPDKSSAFATADLFVLPRSTFRNDGWNRSR